MPGDDISFGSPLREQWFIANPRKQGRQTCGTGSSSPAPHL